MIGYDYLYLYYDYDYDDCWKYDGVCVIFGNQFDINVLFMFGMNCVVVINFVCVGVQKLWVGIVNIRFDVKIGVYYYGYFESVIYVVKGKVWMCWGESL